MMRFKCKGVTIAATAIAIIAWMFLGYIAFIVMASPFSVLASARTARQAEQYAEFVASSLRLVSYDELDTAAHGRRSLAGEIADAADWESSVTLSDERHFGDDAENVQRIATVDIFRTGDTLSRYTLQVPLSSANGGGLGAGFNNLITITESCNWIAPVSGWYEFHIKGAGGGGSSGYVYNPPSHQWTQGGNGGGEGGTTITFLKLKKDDIAYITIGKGGNNNCDGEDTTLVIHGKSFVGGGGGGGHPGSSPGIGGTGTIPGSPGQMGDLFYHPNAAITGGSGGGAGAGASTSYYAGLSGKLGSGGSGGGAWAHGSVYAGGTGGNGVVWIKYFDPKKK